MSSTEFIYLTMGASLMFLITASGYFLFAINEQNRLTKILGFTLLFWSLQTVKDLIAHIYVDFSSPEIHNLYNIVDITAIPMCLFFVKELIMPGWFTWSKFMAHELPLIVLITIYIIFPLDFIFYAILIFCVIYTAFNVGILVAEARTYTKNLKERYSYTEGIGIQWLTKILALFFIFSMVWIASCIIESEYRDGLYYIISILLWSSIGYHINKQKSMEAMSETKENDFKHIKSPGEDFPQLKESLDNLFTEKKIFLNPTLTLNDVAREVGTNRTYLSEYLNNELNSSFFDYINMYRLNYACESLLNTDHTLNTIAENSGFNSISTFRRYFNKRYGCTPLEYRKRHLTKSHDYVNKTI